VAAAEKEGEVSIYGQPRAGVGKAILSFKDAYPKIKINFVGGSGSDLAKKIMAEKRAGKHLVDIGIGGGGRWYWSSGRDIAAFRRDDSS
jgi:hypothetical protein